MTGYTEAGLYSCAKKRPELFDVILLGCAAKDWMNRRDDDLPWFLKSQNS